ncbi:MAG: hypothetical protein ACYCO0_03835 [Candidatus Micrarchaeaceae archaeon]
MKLKEGEEVDFFRIDDKSFVFAKKSDITNMILGVPKQQEAPVRLRYEEASKQYGPSAEELNVLKKIDTIRYENRTQENTLKILDDSEKKILQRLIANRYVSQFKGKSGKELYSIPKSIYDSFLMRKKPQPKQGPYDVTLNVTHAERQDENIVELEKNGFIVLQTEAEASKVSLLLEQSIRHGQVLGTRSFSKNREFYILLRNYFDRYAQSILKKLRDKSSRVSDLAKELGINEDGARAILYILAENGDVMEKKKEIFAIA